MQQRHGFFKKDKLSKQQLGEWFILLKGLLDNGFSLKQAVRFTAIFRIKSAKLGQQVDQKLGQGISLAAALKPQIPIDIYYQLYLAEKHGSLRDSLTAISQHYVLQEKERRRLQALLAYPCMLLCLLLLLFIGIQAFIMPQISDLPGNNQSSMHSVMIYLLTVLLCATLIAIWRWCKFRRLTCLEKAVIRSRLPLIGQLWRNYYAYYVCDALSLMLSQGLSLKEVCDSLLGYDEHALLCQLAQRYQSLGGDATALVQQLSFIPEEVLVLINRGLTTRDLGCQLAMLAHLKFEQLEQLYEKRLSMVQPILFGVIAIGIIGMYLSILLPIYHAMQGAIS